MIATGGLSIPKIGATDFGYSIATFGSPYGPTARLVPFCSAPESEPFAHFMAFRLTRWCVSATRTFARIFSLPTAGSAARRSCRSPRTGGPGGHYLDRFPRKWGFPADLCRHGIPCTGPQRLETKVAETERPERLHHWSVVPVRHGRLRQGRGDGAAWTRASLSSKTMEVRGCPGCISSEKSWTSPATSADTTSSGPGPRDTWPDKMPKKC